MRLPSLHILLGITLLLTLSVVVQGFDKLDYEIFELWDEVRKHDSNPDHSQNGQPQHPSWYQILGVTKKSTTKEINKAYRKLSIKYHPDKNPMAALDPSIGKKFSRLGSIAAMLRDPHKRERYNFYLKNGVPVWRGTGYLYRRWRPGFGTVLVGLLFFASGFQYLYAHLSYWRAQQRIKDLELFQKEKERNEMSRRGGGAQNNAADNAFVNGDGEVQVDYDQDSINYDGTINPWAVPPPSWNSVLVVKLGYYVVNAVRTRALGYEPLALPSSQPTGQFVHAHGRSANNSPDSQDSAAFVDEKKYAKIVADGKSNAAETLGYDSGTTTPESAAEAAIKPKNSSSKSKKNKTRQRKTPKV
ncbi:hypothetical protein H4219_003120 [Mycoemilia scoparia]|uniref:J domain-containing protein n=1 Tax=Mycoemilia scoparia TaxID=417184 RepID=A0A9W7ZVR6_9FUNG|nr:hypothetical protein H4219_003120 [Mycoemilia scoparia]